MIPKIIHCCWFGGNPKPEIIDWVEKKLGKKAASIYVFLSYDPYGTRNSLFCKKISKKAFWQEDLM